MSKALVRIPVERIEKAIFLIRGEKVMLDRDLASLYEVTTSALKQSVRRNIERFPADFMFVLDQNEFENWRSQIVISNSDRMGIRYPPMAWAWFPGCRPAFRHLRLKISDLKKRQNLISQFATSSSQHGGLG